MKRWAIATLLLTALLLTGCGKREAAYEDVQNPIATITMADGSVMRLELYPRYAPNTVANFVTLANRGYYDGVLFYRVVSNVLIQAGDQKNDGTGDPGYYIRGEFSENGVDNPLSHTRGTISMSRKSGYDTGGSTFFIMEGSYPEYDGYYAAFGSLMDDESFTTLDSIGSRPVDGNYAPLDRVVISRIRVETFDVKYEPERLDKKSVDEKRKGGGKKS